jgi:hypothetical protein
VIVVLVGGGYCCSKVGVEEIYLVGLVCFWFGD